MVERLNTLTPPVSVACLVAGLARPLSLVATTSIVSLQPAQSQHSPRIFILLDGLVMSVVPAGEGKDLVELGELVTDGRTTKAELAFPITDPLKPEAPFTRLVAVNPNQTNCSICHRAETPHPSIPGAFVSTAYRPEGSSLVSLQQLQWELSTCDPMADRARCELLVALLGLGDVKAGQFPAKFELMVQ